MHGLKSNYGHVIVQMPPNQMGAIGKREPDGTSSWAFIWDREEKLHADWVRFVFWLEEKF